jgi:peptidoglycan/LPS O-acetylase OafA/YrhL
LTIHTHEHALLMREDRHSSNQTPAPAARESLPALTGARFFAAFAVVVTHYGADTVRAIHPALLAPAASGPLAVSLFYVLSGAVITWGCTRADGTPARPRKTFWAQRAARVAPAYFLALGLSLIPFVFSVLELHPGSAGVLRCLASVVAALFVVQAFFPPVTAGLNTPGWSISCEAFFYALWPRLVAALQSDGRSVPHDLARRQRR